jgi:hypothetical protein
MSILSDIGSLFSGGGYQNQGRGSGVVDRYDSYGAGGVYNTYGPSGNMSRADYRDQYGGRGDVPAQRRGGQGGGQGGGQAKPKTIDELMAEFDVSQYVPTAPATSYMPFYNAIPLDYSNTAGPQSPATQMDYGQMVQQSLLAAPQPSMPSGILGPSMQTQTPLTAPISYEDFLRYYRGGQ